MSQTPLPLSGANSGPHIGPSIDNLPRLILTGPESTGKSTLGQALAERLDGVFVAEYLRDYFAAKGRLSLADAVPIAQGQWDAEMTAGAGVASHRPLICDTDLLSSIVYNAHYYASERNTALWAAWEAWLRDHLALLRKPPFAPRLYILCHTDWPWIDDGQRDAPHLRQQFFTQFEAALQRHDCIVLTVSGSLQARIEQVLSALALDC